MELCNRRNGEGRVRAHTEDGIFQFLAGPGRDVAEKVLEVRFRRGVSTRTLTTKESQGTTKPDTSIALTTPVVVISLVSFHSLNAGSRSAMGILGMSALAR